MSGRYKLQLFTDIVLSHHLDVSNLTTLRLPLRLTISGLYSSYEPVVYWRLSVSLQLDIPADGLTTTSIIATVF